MKMNLAFLAQKKINWSPLFFVFFVAVSAFWLLSFLFMSTVPLNGDEHSYARLAMQISEFFRGDREFRDLVKTLVGYGWFMPGPSLLLSPLFFLIQDPSVFAIRLYTSLVVYALWLFSLFVMQKEFGKKVRVLFLLFPTANITWLLFASTTWGDLTAGLLLLMGLTKSFDLSKKVILRGENINWTGVLQLELIFIAMVYMRGNLFLVALASHIMLLIFTLLRQGGGFSLKNTRLIIIGVFVFLLSILPWSLLCTTTLKAWVMTTSTPVLSLGVTFGDREKLCFGACPPGNHWVVAADFSRKVARESGESELDVQRRMVAKSLEGITVKKYLQQVKKNYDRFLFDPTAFPSRFLQISDMDISEDVKNRFLQLIQAWTNFTYYPFLFGLIISNLLVFKARPDLQLLSLYVKAYTLCIFIQPFVHGSHGRYWVTFAPIMMLSVYLVYNFFIGYWIKPKAEHQKVPLGKGLRNVFSGIQLLYVPIPIAVLLLYVCF